MKMRIWTWILIAALVCLPIHVSAEETEMACTAVLGFANSGWTVQEWGGKVSTTVTGAGTYSLRLDAAANEAELLWVDIQGAYRQIMDAGLTLTDLHITADGREVAVDLSKILILEAEGSGSYRIEIYNRFGDTGEDPGIDPAAINFTSELVITFTLHPAEDPEDAPEDPLPIPEPLETAPSADAQDTGVQVPVEHNPWLFWSIFAAFVILLGGVGVFLLLKKRHG